MWVRWVWGTAGGISAETNTPIQLTLQKSWSQNSLKYEGSRPRRHLWSVSELYSKLPCWQFWIQFVDGPQPMQSAQHGREVIEFPRVSNQTSSGILDWLQFLQYTFAYTTQKTVAVIQAATISQSFSLFRSFSPRSCTPVSVNEPPPVIAAWQALYGHSNLPMHSSSLSVLFKWGNY